jgi:hypothetical protein
MNDTNKGRIREDVFDEKVLSCIIESKIRLNRVPDILSAIKEIMPSLNTIVSLGVSTRCDDNGNDPLREILRSEGYDAWRAKINLGMGRRTKTIINTEERRYDKYPS